jgi:hypothetical protein
MTRIVGVHGIGNYRYHRATGSAAGATDAISRDWTNWLRAGLPTQAQVDLRVGYYAHLLHRGTPPRADDPALLEPAAQDMLITCVEQLESGPRIPQGPRTARARQAADWLGRRFGRTARLTAIVFCRETHTYLADPESPRRKAARDAVAAAIAKHQAETVISHSLGSVVTYEALWRHPELRVDLLVTLGSPLGMPHVVFNRLQPAPANGRGARPPNVARWVNLADAGDIIATPPDLPEHFDGINHHNGDLAIDKWGFHAVKSYLACPQTTQALVNIQQDRGA